MLRLIEKLFNVKIISKYEYDYMAEWGASHSMNKKLFAELKKALDNAEKNDTIVGVKK